MDLTRVGGALLVSGPRRSGVSTALAVLAAGAAEAGIRVVRGCLRPVDRAGRGGGHRSPIGNGDAAGSAGRAPGPDPARCRRRRRLARRRSSPDGAVPHRGRRGSDAGVGLPTGSRPARPPRSDRGSRRTAIGRPVASRFRRWWAPGCARSHVASGRCGQDAGIWCGRVRPRRSRWRSRRLSSANAGHPLPDDGFAHRV